MRRLVGTVSVVLLFAACGERPTAVQEDLGAPQLGAATIARDGPISFTGHTTFNAFLPKSGTWFLKDFQCEAEAVLVFGDGNHAELTTTETCFATPRVIVWTGSVAPGGAVKLAGPESEADAVAEHTGCTISGTFPVYHGYFDGEVLSASGHFHGLCDGGTIWGPVMGFPLDDPGPVNAEFGFVFTVN
jgi:hypothetical protein